MRAVPLLIGFIALLVWLAWMADHRKKRHRATLQAQRAQLTAQEELLQRITKIAAKSSDVDPSAELILLEINDYARTKELT